MSPVPCPEVRDRGCVPVLSGLVRLLGSQQLPCPLDLAIRIVSHKPADFLHRPFGAD